MTKICWTSELPLLDTKYFYKKFILSYLNIQYKIIKQDSSLCLKVNRYRNCSSLNPTNELFLYYYDHWGEWQAQRQMFSVGIVHAHRLVIQALGQADPRAVADSEEFRDKTEKEEAPLIVVGWIKFIIPHGTTATDAAYLTLQFMVCSIRTGANTSRFPPPAPGLPRHVPQCYRRTISMAPGIIHDR